MVSPQAQHEQVGTVQLGRMLRMYPIANWFNMAEDAEDEKSVRSPISIRIRPDEAFLGNVISDSIVGRSRFERQETGGSS